MKIRYIDLHEIFNRIGYQKLEDKQGDGTHPNLMGHMIAARKFINRYYMEIGITDEEKEKIMSATVKDNIFPLDNQTYE